MQFTFLGVRSQHLWKMCFFSSLGARSQHKCVLSSLRRYLLFSCKVSFRVLLCTFMSICEWADCLVWNLEHWDTAYIFINFVNDLMGVKLRKTCSFESISFSLVKWVSGYRYPYIMSIWKWADCLRWNVKQKFDEMQCFLIVVTSHKGKNMKNVSFEAAYFSFVKRVSRYFNAHILSVSGPSEKDKL